MKKLFLFALTLALVAPVSFSKAKGEPKELKVMSYNIRLGVANDGTNSWQFRAPATPAMLEAQKPDVFGVQEAHDFQIAFMEEFCRVGMYFDNVSRLVVKNVKLEGVVGDELVADHIGELIRE